MTGVLRNKQRRDVTILLVAAFAAVAAAGFTIGYRMVMRLPDVWPHHHWNTITFRKRRSRR